MRNNNKRGCEKKKVINKCPDDILRPCLHGMGDPGLVGQVSFVLCQDDLLYHIDFNRRHNARESFSQLVVPAALRFEILSNVHDHIAGAHFRLNKTFSKLNQGCWWQDDLKMQNIGLILALSVQ